MLFPMGISVFVINCLVVGTNNGGLPCDMIAWINSGSILVSSIIILVIISFAIFILDKIDLPEPKKILQKKIPNEQFKIVK